MKRLVTADDIRDLYFKSRQRGLGFIASKMDWRARVRTASAFNETFNQGSNWWIIPEVNRRWNKLITSNADVSYEQMVCEQYLAEKTNLKMLSVGCGDGKHEIAFAKAGNFDQIVCLDLSKPLLSEAEQDAKAVGLTQMRFVNQSLEEYNMVDGPFDLILFNASLHHFSNVEELLSEQIKPALKEDGILVINEYVGPDRMQFSEERIKRIESTLRKIPKKYRSRLGSRCLKTSFSGSGWLRVYLADPSECVDSSSIVPALRQHFRPVFEKGYGGSIAPHVLKDISHHFVAPEQRASEALEMVFEADDEYMKEEDSDFFFGIYRV